MSWRHNRQPWERRRKMEKTPSQTELDKFIDELKPEYIIGIDEVGWGAIAGPIVVACAVYKTGYSNGKIKDSKAYSTKKSREKGFQLVQDTAEYVSYKEATVGEIETHGPGGMLQHLFKTIAERAISHYPNSLVVIDGSHVIKDLNHDQVCMPKADVLVTAVSAASVAAKVSRDHTMEELGKSFPEFEWHSNAGYGVKAHIDAMRKHGVCIHHRRNIDLVFDFETKYGTYERISL